MDRERTTPPELGSEPEKTGESDTSKKKKKRSTRVPLPVDKKEAEAPDKNQPEDNPEPGLDELFAKKVEDVEEAENFAKSISGVEIVKLEKAAHYPQEHWPQEISESLLLFLRKKAV